MILDVGCDSDHRKPRSVRTEPDSLADRIYPRPDFVGKRLIDNEGSGRQIGVLFIQVSAMHQRDAQHPEIIGTDDLRIGDVDIGARRSTLNLKGRIRRNLAHRQLIYDCDCLNTRQPSHPILQLIVKAGGLPQRIASFRQRQSHRNHVLRIKAEADAEQFHKTANHESSAS